MIARLALVLAAVGAALVPLPASWVESLYSARVYLALQRPTTSFSNRVPFALFDVLLAAAAAWLILVLAAFVRRWRHRGLVGAAIVLVSRLAAAAAFVYIVFLAMWGLNYRRVPMTARVDFSTSRVTREATLAMARDTAARTNELEAEAHRVGWPDWPGVGNLLAASYARVQEQLRPGSAPAVPGVPKVTVLTVYFERSGVDGMTDPFFLETLVNGSVLPFERPALTAHEWGHLAGYADESEASFFGWLVCLQGPPPAQYSADLSLLWQLLPALPASDRETVVRTLHPAVRADLKAIADRVARATPAVRAASWRIYDRYLKANRVAEGVKSYDAALALLLGTRFAPGWVPQLAR